MDSPKQYGAEPIRVRRERLTQSLPVSRVVPALALAPKINPIEDDIAAPIPSLPRVYHSTAVL